MSDDEKPAEEVVHEKPTAEPETVPPIDAGSRDLTIEDTAEVLHKQVDIARKAFYRLAQVRGADLVLYEGKSLHDALSYADAELQQLDGQLASVVPAARQV